ncbi:MAG: ferredoxin [Gemmatimonadetes bacterium]|nr:ferredoxin [Gemmatimonadota bacterium]MXX33998.1 ferredoxin [Gemmatimonadota bacterium]MYA10716.1 ferredoxin [Gemmatimonadota bacterium]MYD12301.1 ferredoxin [Gemmatimonadota bacterium]MYE70140.1 ferredoxin [Gemmatimonadota bacterium]
MKDASSAARGSAPDDPPPLAIQVDHMRCAGNAMCLALAPGVFAHNHWRQSEVVDPEGDALEDVLEAAGNCPTSAITVSDASTGEVLFP